MRNTEGFVATVWLKPEAAALVDQCVQGNVSPSLSDFLDAVLTVFQQHSQALLHYIEQQEAKGFTHEEILGS